MSLFYETIGRLVVLFVRTRYRSELRVAGAVGLAALALGVAGYLAARGDDEQA